MANEIKYRDILYNNEQIGKYPLDKLKRVDKITTRYVGDVERRDPREHALAVPFRGDYGEKVKELAPKMTVSEPLGASLVSMQRHINNFRQNEVAAKKAPIPDDPRVLARHVKSLGYFLGADMVGICELPQSAVYSHDMDGNPIEAPYKYAIVLLCRKDATTIEASCGYDWIFDPVSFQTYQRLACQTETMANYLRRLGHEAAPSNMWNYLTLMPQLILEAGLGEESRMGIAVNPFVGGNFKSAAVLTNLPLEVDKPIDFGLQEYCKNCTICAEQCPTQAISYGEKEVYNGYEAWKMDERKCSTFNILNTKGCVCGRCTKFCPWGGLNTDPEDFKDWDGTNESLKAMADARAKAWREKNYKSEQETTHKWWFDLEKVDDEYVIPPTTERL
ncbi:MAG: 4Fe-4S dicluster domain-containing protein [Anaerovoracaceae bacterium]|jgi:epoxyqueuosine reductase